VALEYLLSQPDPKIYDEGCLKLILFVNNLTTMSQTGEPSNCSAVAIPSLGLILINLNQLQTRLSQHQNIGWATLDNVRIVLHEIMHHLDHQLLDDITQTDVMLSALLPGHTFPAPGANLENVTSETRARLPRRSLYSATAPLEWRADAGAEVWMHMGQNAAPQRGMLGYWLTRTRHVMPAAHSLFEPKDRPIAGRRGEVCPEWLNAALQNYRNGAHDEQGPIDAALEKMRGKLICLGTVAFTRENPNKKYVSTPQYPPEMTPCFGHG